MKQELLEIISRLKSDPLRLISVYYSDNEAIVRSVSAQKLKEIYGSVEDFFGSLTQETPTTILVEERRKNGSSSILLSAKKSFELIKKMPQPFQPIQNPPVIYHNSLQEGLKAAQSMGLGLPEIMNLHIAANDKVRLETENNFLKKENENLKNEIAVLKEEKLQNKYSQEKAKSSNQMLLGIVQNIPMLLAAFKGDASQVALQGATYEPEPEEMQGVKAELFSRLETTSEAIDDFMLRVLNGVLTNEDFYIKVSELLKN